MNAIRASSKARLRSSAAILRFALASGRMVGNQSTDPPGDWQTVQGGQGDRPAAGLRQNEKGTQPRSTFTRHHTPSSTARDPCEPLIIVR